MKSWILVLLNSGCATGERHFPLREPMWRDADLDSVRLVLGGSTGC